MQLGFKTKKKKKKNCWRVPLNVVALTEHQITFAEFE